MSNWLYKHGGQLLDAAVPYTRADADALFRDLMRAAGVPRWRVRAAYLAVRAFGGSSWRTA